MKRNMFVMFSVLVAIAMLTACGTPATTQAPATQAPATQAPATEAPTATEAPAAPVEVTLWHAYGTGSAEETALTAVLAKAAVDLPQYKINVLQVPFNDIYNKYRTDVAAGGGPDMFVAPNDSLGDDARAGLIADITDLALSKLGDYAPLSVDGMKVDGKLYGIPESLKALAFWYDKTKLATPPATTDELKSLMEGGTPVSISYGCYHQWGFYGAFGGTVFDANNKVAADNQGMIDAVTYLNSIYQISKANSWPKTDSDGLAPFTEGKVVAITNGNWAMGDYQNALGDNLAVAPLPAGSAGPATPLLGVDGYMINPNSQVQAAAIDVALYLTGASAEEEMMKAGHVPAISTATVTNPLLKSLVDIFKNGTVRPQFPELGKYWSNFCGTDQVFEKGTDPATWLKDATDASNK
jgi:arabinogalactan oligomer / maltooligosaccharide transport system substrate-binding protein